MSHDTVGRDTTDTTHRHSIDGVVVTATRTERSIRALPVSTSVMTRHEVEATPAQSLDDVLRTIPGVNLPFESSVVQHPTANAISMRGLGGTHTLVLLDGVPLNDPFFGYVQWNKVPMELIQRIEVVRGGASSLFGTYAMGGVIDVVTRKPSEDDAEVETQYGTDNTRRGNLLLSHSVIDALRLTADANYFNTDGYLRPMPSEVGPVDRPAHSEAQNLYLNADYTPNKRTSGYLRSVSYRFDQNQGSPLGTDGQNVWDLTAGMRHQYRPGGTVQGDLFYEADHFVTTNTDPITQRGVDEYVSNAHVTPAATVGGSLQWSQYFTAAKTMATAGVDFRVLHGEDRANNYSAPDAFAYREIGGGAQRSAGLFAQGDYFVNEQLELLASARLDAWQNYDGHDFRTTSPAQQYPDRSAVQLDPKLAIRYYLSHALMLRGAAYRAFNAPTLDALYRPFSASGYDWVSNPQLRPETLLGGELGAEYNFASESGRSTGTLQVTAFQNSVHDELTAVTIAFSPVFTQQPANVSQSRSRGIEVLGDWQPVPGWRLNAGYTLTDSRVISDATDSTVIGKLTPDVPRNELTATAGYYVPRRLSGFVRGRYVGERFSDATNDVRLDPHFVLDASLSYPLFPVLDAYVEGQNLLNRLYVVSGFGFDARGTPRQVFFGLRARLTEQR